MSHLRIRLISTVAAAPLLLVGLAATPEALPAQGQASPLIITMRAMQNPLAPSQCTAIEVVVTDASGRAPIRPDGKQVSGWDVDLSLASQAADAFAWGDERHRFLCAKAPTAPYAVVSAHYPAQSLTPAQRIENVQVDQYLQVAMQMPGAPAAGYNQQPATGAANGPATGYQQPAIAPGQPYVPPANPAVGQPDYSQAGNQQYAPQQQGAPQQAPGAPAQQAYAPPVNPAPGVAPAGAASPPAPQQTSYAAGPATPAPVSAPAAAPTLVQPAEKSGGGFFKKLGKHLKDKANEVKNQTTENLTTTATQMVDVTAQTGSNLVSGAAAQATSVAQSAVGGVTNSLVPAALRTGGEGDNLAYLLASGTVELRAILFVGNSSVLSAKGRLLANSLAGALDTIPGIYRIEVHVDPLPAPAPQGAAEDLSKERAGSLRQALVDRNKKLGPRLVVMGYGASQPMPETPLEGGPPSSARVMIVRTQ